MITLSQQSNLPKTMQEFENSSHISKKKKAIATTFKNKNFKDVVELINDEDIEVSAMYAKYIR